MEIAIIAGEVSGDIQAARLVKAIKNISPSMNIWGIGGPMMQKEGVELVRDITELAVVGFWEVVKNYKKIRNVFYDILDKIEIKKPKAVILVDYPGFNLRLAKKIKQLGIPVIYYISPQVWAWGRGRIKEIREVVDKMIVIFPFEKEMYEKEDVPVEFVGHPIIDIINERVSERNKFRNELNLSSNEKLVGILPGSRVQEVKRHLPVFLETADRIKNTKFVIAAASKNIYELIRSILLKKKYDIPILINRTYEIMESCDLILTSSGTATIEAACFGTPMIVIYKLNWLTYIFAKNMVNVPYIAMANLIRGKKIVPEFIQEDATPENIANEAVTILQDASLIKRELTEVRKKLGEGGAAKKAAKIICELIIN